MASGARSIRRNLPDFGLVCWTGAVVAVSRSIAQLPSFTTTIFETPKHNWGFRGLPGDEHQLNYKIEV
jgi:hypothetical protein